MKIRNQIFLAFFTLLVGVLVYALRVADQELRPRYMEAVEDTLVDESHLLVHLISKVALKSDVLQAELIQKLFESGDRKILPAKIHGKLKAFQESRIYICDSAGKVIFDSDGAENIGKDFSQWNDVYLTLKGQYGARSTRSNPDNPMSSVLFVAAPILSSTGTMLGTLTVGKSLSSFHSFMLLARKRLLIGVSQVLGIALLLTLALAWMISRNLEQLKNWSLKLGTFEEEPLPKMDSLESRELGLSLQKMKAKLDSKEYVENYVTNLTHEIKSPLTAIIGAAELVSNPSLAIETRNRFAANIVSESIRLKEIVDNMLELSSVEKSSRSMKLEKISLSTLLEELKESFQASLLKRSILINISCSNEIYIFADRFLMWRCLSNLIQNAIDFSLVHVAPAENKIEIHVSARDGGEVQLQVLDEGVGLSHLAQKNLFQKFFSSERPNSASKGTGLGLAFCKEVLKKHSATLTLENRTPKGVKAEIRFSKQQS